MALITNTILICDGAECSNVILSGDRIGVIASGIFNGVREDDDSDTINFSTNPDGAKPQVLCGDCTDQTAAELAITAQFTEAVVNLSLANIEATEAAR